EEEQVMEHCIKEALACPSTSTVSTSIFIVKKKDGGLGLCVDYRGYIPARFKKHEGRCTLKTEAHPTSQEPVLPSSCFVGTICWNLDCNITVTNPNHNCPPGRFYISPRCRTALILWAHTALRSRHPGSTQVAQ
ncbi:hypothetical protein P4O66_021888, partial [Electrophorus voltai]